MSSFVHIYYSLNQIAGVTVIGVSERIQWILWIALIDKIY
jgi:hypothetical protein